MAKTFSELVIEAGALKDKLLLLQAQMRETAVVMRAVREQIIHRKNASIAVTETRNLLSSFALPKGASSHE